MVHNLRRQVVGRATEGRATILDAVSGPAEVAKLDDPSVPPVDWVFTALKDEDVLRLDVAVNYVALLAAVQGRHDLLDNRPDYSLLERAVLHELAVEVAIRCVLHDEVHVMLVVEEAVELHDVRAFLAQPPLDLSLSFHLLVAVVMIEDFHLDLLDGDFFSAAKLDGLEDGAKLALANLVKEFEVFDGEGQLWRISVILGWLGDLDLRITQNG